MKRQASTFRLAGFTLAEMLIASAISSMVMAGLLVACLSLRRSFEATSYHMNAQNDQLRVLDQLGHDLRSASSVSIVNGGTKLSGTLQVSNSNPVSLRFGAPLLNLLSAPTDGIVTKPLAIFLEGGQLIRDLGGQQTVLAETISALRLSRSGSIVTVELEFSPRYSRSLLTASQSGTKLTSRIFLRNSGSN